MAISKWATHAAPARKAISRASPSNKTGSIRIEAPDSDRVITKDGKVLSHHVSYVRSKGIDDFVMNVHAAGPIELIETERQGVAGVFVKDLSKRMQIPAQRMFDILGVPKATAEKKVAAGELLTGNGGRAALGMARLLGLAMEIAQNSTAPEAKDFDSAKWLGQWLDRPQPALGGRRPSEFIDTPTGLDVVTRLLGAIESGAYQ